MAVTSTLPLVLQRHWHGGCQTRRTAMAKNGLVIYILVITLLLDQTSCHASKFKARKHSKRRVKGNGVPPSSRTLGCSGWGGGGRRSFPDSPRRPSLLAVTMASCGSGIFRGQSDLLILWDCLTFKESYGRILVSYNKKGSCKKTFCIVYPPSGELRQLNVH